MTPEDILAVESTGVLTLMLKKYCETNNLPYESADELILELLERMAETKNHIGWLTIFSAQWEAVQAREDAAACKRTGHRDTGRGVCADCGEFI